MNDQGLSPWMLAALIVLFFPIFFVALWMGITRLLSGVSGWTTLAPAYAGRVVSPTARAQMATGSMGRVPVSFRSVLTVEVGDEGVGLSLPTIFASGAPPLLIPWDHVVDGHERRLGPFHSFRFHTREPRVPVTVSGRAARLVMAEWERRAARDVPPVPSSGPGRS
jgi:hypothetical protein